MCYKYMSDICYSLDKTISAVWKMDDKDLKLPSPAPGLNIKFTEPCILLCML